MVENIRMIESFIDNAKDRFHLDDDIYGNIMIAVTEAVNNAIKHGNSNNKTKNVHLSLFLQDSMIKFIVKDEGEGFNYDDLPDPTAPENLKKPGGRGIFLMKHLSDEVEFKDNGRIVELSFYMNA
jgi:serine/threonine-protein kinase RsbW